MKVYAMNYNGVLDSALDYMAAREMLTDDYHAADIFLLWQDVRGECRELAQIAKHHMGKPVVVMQHGRGATRDYCPPNSFPLTADKILVWGKSEKDRMVRRDISPERIEIVGCPLFPYLRPKEKGREGKNVLFAPVIAQKEEPENLMVYAALKEWESRQLLRRLQSGYADFKRAWATEENHMRPVQKPDGTVENRIWKKQIVPRIGRNMTYSGGLINVKLTGIHDGPQYMAPVIASQQNDPNHIRDTVETLRNTDVLVCLEEGTMQLLACALDIPIIHVDIFKYGNYGGTANYDHVDKIQTPACYRTTKLEKVARLLDRALANPHELRAERIAVCEEEGGASLGDINANIVRALETCLKIPVKA